MSLAAHLAGLTFREVLDYAEQLRQGFPLRRRPAWVSRALARAERGGPPEDASGGPCASDPILVEEAVARAREALREAERRRAENAARAVISEHPDLDECEPC